MLHIGYIQYFSLNVLHIIFTNLIEFLFRFEVIQVRTNAYTYFIYKDKSEK